MNGEHPNSPASMSTDPVPRFWSDDFDMDLPKIIPEARERLGKYADLELVTHGHTTFNSELDTKADEVDYEEESDD